jgi:hypothetical protein
MTVENSKSKAQPSKFLGLHVYGNWLRIFNAKEDSMRKMN